MGTQLWFDSNRLLKPIVPTENTENSSFSGDLQSKKIYWLISRNII